MSQSNNQRVTLLVIAGLLQVLSVAGCSTSQGMEAKETAPSRVLDVNHIDDYCGKLVEVTGIAIRTKIPSILVGQNAILVSNISAWPEYCLDKRVTVYGLLCRADPTPEEIEYRKLPTDIYLREFAKSEPQKPYYYITFYFIPNFDYETGKMIENTEPGQKSEETQK